MDLRNNGVRQNTGLPCAAAVLLAGAATLAGCTSDPGFTGVTGMNIADASEVTTCRYISDLRMSPSVYGPLLAQQGQRYVRNKIMADAKDAGADTVVFDKVTPGSDVYEMHAVAYRCRA